MDEGKPAGQVIALSNMFQFDRLHRAIEDVLYTYSMRGTVAYGDQNRYLIRHFLTTSLPQIIHVSRYRAAETTPILCLPADFASNGFDRKWVMTAPGKTSSLTAVQFNQLPGFTDMYKPSHLRHLERFNGAAMKVARQNAAAMSARLERAGELTLLHGNYRQNNKALMDNAANVSYLLSDDALAAIGAPARKQVRRALLAMFYDETLFPQLEGETTKLHPNMLENIAEDQADSAISTLLRKIDTIETRILAPGVGQAMHAAGAAIDRLLEDYELTLARDALDSFLPLLDADTLKVMRSFVPAHQTPAVYSWLNPHMEVRTLAGEGADKRSKTRVLNEKLADARRDIVSQFPLLLSSDKALRLINRTLADEAANTRDDVQAIPLPERIASAVWHTHDVRVLDLLRGKTARDIGADIAYALPRLAPALDLVPDAALPRAARDWQMLRRVHDLSERLADYGMVQRGRVMADLANVAARHGWASLQPVLAPEELENTRGLEWALGKMMNQTGGSLISRMFLRLARNMNDRWPQLDFHADIFPLCQVDTPYNRRRGEAVSKMQAANQNMSLPATYYHHVPVRKLFAMAAAHVTGTDRQDAEWTQERALRELMFRNAGATTWPPLPHFPVSWYVDNNLISIDDDNEMGGWMAESCDTAYDVIMSFIDRIKPEERPHLSIVAEVVSKRAHFIRMISPHDGRAVGYLKICEIQDEHDKFLEFDPDDYTLYTPDRSRYVMASNKLQEDIAAYIRGLNTAAIPATPFVKARAKIASQFPAANSMETLVDGNPFDIEETHRIRRRLAPILREDHHGQDLKLPHGLYGFWDQELETAMAKMVAAHPSLTGKRNRNRRQAQPIQSI